MATFSPSPAPRRSSRMQKRAASPPRRNTATGNNRNVSRLTTPTERVHYINDGRPVLSGMDVDDERINLRTTRNNLLSKSDELEVTFYANLPVELKQILKNADFYGDAYTGEVDTLTGFALVASVRTCFVWQYAQAVNGTPTCYIFSCPRDNDHPSLPFHVLVPFGSSREPGLILISLGGVIHFWDSISIGLAGGDHYSTLKLDIPGQQVTNFIRSDAQTYIVSTTSGGLFRLILTSAGGKHNLSYHSFARPSQSLSLTRLIPSIFSSASTSLVNRAHSQNISAIAIGMNSPTGGREVWALVDTHMQKWDMKAEGWEQLLLDSDISPVLMAAIKESFGEYVEDEKSVDLELLDLAVERSGRLAVLISFAAAETAYSMTLDTKEVRRIYALTCISYLGEIPRIESVRSVPYQNNLSYGAPTHPRIQLLSDGLVIGVQFGNAVAFCSRDSGFRDRLELKSTKDRTLGVGIVKSDNTLLILTASTVMKVSVDIDGVVAFDPENGQAGLIKSTMTQAILYSFPENPLHFSFPPEVDEESLMSGAEQLSRAVLESDPGVVYKNHDLSAQLIGRKERLSWLIRFINDNGVLIKMSQRSRQKLASDAEKLYGCYNLWIRHNNLLATNPTHSILNDVVHAYMEEVGDDHHEDVMRAFFRLRAAEIGRLIKKVGEVTTHAPRTTGKDISEFLPEANNIVLTILQSAFDYRESNIGIYGIVLPMIKPWSSRPAIIDVILGLFNATTKVVDSIALRGETMDRNDAPNSQLPGLAAVLFACIQERLEWLENDVGSAETGSGWDYDELQKKFSLLRPEILETLRKHGHTDAAFTLAEEYQDFSSLAALCHKEAIYPPQDNPNFSRIQDYIERYKEGFTQELYRWYIQHGELRIMFAQDGILDAHMEDFFKASPNPMISWMHDLGKARHDAAAAALLQEAEHANNLEAKHLMLSIGKLSYLAQLHETEASMDDSVLDAFHDDLDIVSVHEALLQEFKSAFENIRGRQSIEAQVDTILTTKASMLSETKALAQIFKGLVRELLQGKALSIEDIVDVLTMKDNHSTLQDFATALHLLARVKDLPEARKISAFRTVWRRIYIHDDWDAIRKTTNISDTELNERFRNTALYSTFHAMPQEEQGLEAQPDMALLIPSKTEIASRWPGMPPDQIEAVFEDYNIEGDRLGEMDLNDMYHRIQELVAHDDSWQADV